ncbi:RelA/SpoT domain-containing protein [Terasakiella pusilla]|uniref:RelA/SpoT domain-containing protein n=1 Tax=Terasakiella pusilla TaxID=64973 RepID=UPI003AA80826
MPRSETKDILIQKFQEKKHDFRIFMEGVVNYLGEHPHLAGGTEPIVHSYKARLKDVDHLLEKISRKKNQGRQINEDNLFNEITDLAGVRILHLFREDFEAIDKVIQNKVAEGDWVLSERPKAFTWDPETKLYFDKFNLTVEQRDTFYTSVHYLIRPRKDSPICCELQVRTLFEEIWGEVDHRINYPNPTKDISCKEQLMVLSKIVGAGSRLLDSLQRVQDPNKTNASP